MPKEEDIAGLRERLKAVDFDKNVNLAQTFNGDMWLNYSEIQQHFGINKRDIKVLVKLKVLKRKGIQTKSIIQVKDLTRFFKHHAVLLALV